MVIGVGDCTAFVGVAMHCTLVYRLCVKERLKWEESQVNAADRGDRVQSVRNRVYSIIYRCSICTQFVGVQVFLLRVNHACETNRVIAVDNNLDDPLEATMVELSGLLVHCSSLTGLSVRLVVRGLLVCLFVCHSCIARLPVRLPVRLLLVWLFFCHSCIARLPVRSTHRSCTARLSAGPSVGVMIAAASLLHRWVGECGTIGRHRCSSSGAWCCRRRSGEGLQHGEQWWQ